MYAGKECGHGKLSATLPMRESAGGRRKPLICRAICDVFVGGTVGCGAAHSRAELLLEGSVRTLRRCSCRHVQRRSLPGGVLFPRPAFSFPQHLVVALGGVHCAGDAGNNNGTEPAEGGPFSFAVGSYTMKRPA